MPAFFPQGDGNLYENGGYGTSRYNNKWAGTPGTDVNGQVSWTCRTKLIHIAVFTLISLLMVSVSKDFSRMRRLLTEFALFGLFESAVDEIMDLAVFFKNLIQFEKFIYHYQSHQQAT
jgi:hypothetical protein